MYSPPTIQFVKPKGDFDFISPLINLAGTGAVVAIATSALNNFLLPTVLPALGVSNTTATVLTGVTAGLETIGVGGVAAGVMLIGTVFFNF